MDIETLRDICIKFPDDSEKYSCGQELCKTLYF